MNRGLGTGVQLGVSSQSVILVHLIINALDIEALLEPSVVKLYNIL